MTILSSGELALQDAGTNPSGQPEYLSTTLNSGSTSLTLRHPVKTQENSDIFYNVDNTLTGTIYGFKTAQTTSYSGSSRYARGFDDTNMAVTGSFGQILGSGFLDNSDWLGTTPAFSFNETWWTTKGTFGVTLGVDSGSLGSLSTSSYTGGGSTGTLEVHHFGWFNNSSNTYPNGTNSSTIGSQVLNTQEEGNWIMLCLKSTSVSAYPPQTDDSFYSVIINGQEYLRTNATHSGIHSIPASRDSTTSSGTGYYRVWLWSGSITDANLTSIGTTGNKTFKLTSAATTTLNNGIAEEFRGADSADVKMSDYYKDDLHVTAGIPTSGEISFSDFLGKTYASPSVATSFTGGGTGGKLQRKGYAPSLFSIGSNLSPTSQDAFGANVDLQYCYASDNTMRVTIMYDINSGTVDTTSWSTLTISRSGYTSFTISRSALSTNTVSSGNYYITQASNSLTNTQFQMLGGGTVTLTFT